jgi:hypothetical protein
VVARAAEEVEVMDYEHTETEEELLVDKDNTPSAAQAPTRTAEEVSRLFANFPLQGQFAQYVVRLTRPATTPCTGTVWRVAKASPRGWLGWRASAHAPATER